MYRKVSICINLYIFVYIFILLLKQIKLQINIIGCSVGEYFFKMYIIKLKGQNMKKRKTFYSKEINEERLQKFENDALLNLTIAEIFQIAINAAGDITATNSDISCHADCGLYSDVDKIILKYLAESIESDCKQILEILEKPYRKKK